MLNNANNDKLFQFFSKNKLQAKTAYANSHLFITKADQVLSNKPNGIAMSLCKPEEADSCVSSTWNMRLIRDTIKPTSEQWTRVIILDISHLHHLSYASSGWHAEKFESMWYLISKQLGAQCNQALTPFHAYTRCDLPSSMFSIVKKRMKCVECFSCYKHFCRSDLRPNQPYHHFPEYGMSGTPDCADLGPKLWFNLCQWSQQTAFHPWPKVFGLNTTNTSCLPTCKHVHWWSQLSQRC